MQEIVLLKVLEDLARFNRNFSPSVEHCLTFETLKNYDNNRILITAEHAKTARIKSPEHGKEAYIPIGDANTGELARLGAWHLQSAYMIPQVLRTEIDLSRSLEANDLTLTVFPIGAEEQDKKIEVPLNTAKNLIHVSEFYHKKIEGLNPKAILAYHGMHSKHKMDILLGFGPDRNYIGGAKNAFAFKELFEDRLNQTLKELKIRTDISIKVAKSLFTGAKNYTLYRHVGEYNKKNKEKRLGIHVEFNRYGRKMNAYPELPKLRYQIAAQVLAECAGEWKSADMVE